jgi:hypothetical protein
MKGENMHSLYSMADDFFYGDIDPYEGIVYEEKPTNLAQALYNWYCEGQPSFIQAMNECFPKYVIDNSMLTGEYIVQSSQGGDTAIIPNIEGFIWGLVDLIKEHGGGTFYGEYTEVYLNDDSNWTVRVYDI